MKAKTIIWAGAPIVAAILLLLLAFLGVFLQAVDDGMRRCLGAHVNLLPPLVVYAGLRGSLPALTLLAALGGIWFDSLSANPLGVSMLPLFAVGLATHLKQGLILRDQFVAQVIVGFIASAVVPVLTFLLLLTVGQPPLLGWGSLWQWTVTSLGGAVLTPLCFRFLDLSKRALAYRVLSQTSFRSDREIRRGRK